MRVGTSLWVHVAANEAEALCNQDDQVEAADRVDPDAVVVSLLQQSKRGSVTYTRVPSDSLPLKAYALYMPLVTNQSARRKTDRTAERIMTRRSGQRVSNPVILGY